MKSMSAFPRTWALSPTRAKVITPPSGFLLDYVDFVVHIFNAQRRAYYDLERLWKSAHKLTAEELLQTPSPAEAASEVAPAP